MTIIAFILAAPLALLALLLVIRLRAPSGFFLWPAKLAAGALAPLLSIASAVVAVFNFLIADTAIAAILAFLAALVFASYTRRITMPRPQLERAFGEDWWRRIPADIGRGLMARRWNWKLKLPAKEPGLEKDVAFWTVSGGRKLLCDVWTPPAGVKRSGLGLVYFHGSAWTLYDKDYRTRPFFRYLTNQGHVVMDVAYRLSPEADMLGMVADAKRAVAWLKDNAARYNVDPARVVVSGGSAGGQLALLHAFAPHHPELTPPDVQGRDLSVRAVASFYGPSDLRAVYEHTNQQRFKDDPAEVKAPTGQPPAAGQAARTDFSTAGKLSLFMGGRPDQNPALYDLASPVTHAGPHCPPVFVAQGEDDLITPIAATREMVRKLRDANVPVVNMVFPYTDHGFDLAWPEYSPSAQGAWFYLERFLALMVAEEQPAPDRA